MMTRYRGIVYIARIKRYKSKLFGDDNDDIMVGLISKEESKITFEHATNLCEDDNYGFMFPRTSVKSEKDVPTFFASNRFRGRPKILDDRVYVLHEFFDEAYTRGLLVGGKDTFFDLMHLGEESEGENVQDKDAGEAAAVTKGTEDKLKKSVKASKGSSGCVKDGAGLSSVKEATETSTALLTCVMCGFTTENDMKLQEHYDLTHFMEDTESGDGKEQDNVDVSDKTVEVETTNNLASGGMGNTANSVNVNQQVGVPWGLSVHQIYRGEGDYGVTLVCDICSFESDSVTTLSHHYKVQHDNVELPESVELDEIRLLTEGLDPTKWKLPCTQSLDLSNKLLGQLKVGRATLFKVMAENDSKGKLLREYQTRSADIVVEGLKPHLESRLIKIESKVDAIDAGMGEVKTAVANSVGGQPLSGTDLVEIGKKTNDADSELEVMKESVASMDKKLDTVLKELVKLKNRGSTTSDGNSNNSLMQGNLEESLSDIVSDDDTPPGCGEEGLPPPCKTRRYRSHHQDGPSWGQGDGVGPSPGAGGLDDRRRTPPQHAAPIDGQGHGRGSRHGSGQRDVVMRAKGGASSKGRDRDHGDRNIRGHQHSGTGKPVDRRYKPVVEENSGGYYGGRRNDSGFYDEHWK